MIEKSCLDFSRVSIRVNSYRSINEEMELEVFVRIFTVLVMEESGLESASNVWEISQGELDGKHRSEQYMKISGVRARFFKSQKNDVLVSAPEEKSVMFASAGKDDNKDVKVAHLLKQSEIG